jgi:hypothetical protein
MDLKEMGDYTRNCGDSAQDRENPRDNPCECGIKLSGYISHGVFNYLFICRDL